MPDDPSRGDGLDDGAGDAVFARGNTGQTRNTARFMCGIGKKPPAGTSWAASASIVGSVSIIDPLNMTSVSSVNGGRVY